MLGEVILNQILQQGSNSIDISNYTNGIYFLNNAGTNFKIVKQ